MSARLPASSEPISLSSPSALAALMVAISRVRSTGMRVGSRWRTCCISAADLHLLDHVDGIVDHRPVGAERHVDARRGARWRTARCRRRGSPRWSACRRSCTRPAPSARCRARCTWMPWIRIHLRIEDAELHQIADVGAAGFAQIFQKALLQRECAAGNMRGDLAGRALWQAHSRGRSVPPCSCRRRPSGRSTRSPCRIAPAHRARRPSACTSCSNSASASSRLRDGAGCPASCSATPWRRPGGCRARPAARSTPRPVPASSSSPND